MSVIDARALEHEKLDEIKVRLMKEGCGLTLKCILRGFYILFGKATHSQQPAKRSRLSSDINSSPVYPSLIVIVAICRRRGGN